MNLYMYIALKHLWARKRQSLVCMMGIVLGVAFFLAISSLMRGSEKDFIARLVDNTPHITVTDEYRNPREQPLAKLFPNAAVDIRSVKPVNEIRGIRGYEQILEKMRRIKGLLASPVLTGQGVVSYGGRDLGITLYGMIPSEIRDVSTITKYIIEGSVDELIANPDGIIIGTELARILALKNGDNFNVVSSAGQVRTFKILGIFRTGRSDFDQQQTFVSIKRVQALLNRPNRANSIVIKLPDPYLARDIATDLERQIGYKSVSWQEASEDIMNTLTIRNIIMYTVVSAVLLVAGLGIYNVISTVVIEKYRDIAILKSMGFRGREIELIFLFQGIVLGILGNILGVPLGMLFMRLLGTIQFKPPGVTEPIQMPIDWGFIQFLIAILFALAASLIAAYFPSRKAAKVQPVHILRGGQ